MTNQQQEVIVIECQKLAKDLAENCAKWLHTVSDRRNEKTALGLGLAADAMYILLHTYTEIMGSDTGKPAFDEFVNEEFQSDMQNLWDNE